MVQEDEGLKHKSATHGFVSHRSEEKRYRSLLDRVFPAPRSFTVRLWDGTELPAPHPAFSLVINHPGALRRMFTPPIELSLGEAFIYGDLDVEGDLFAAFSAMDAAAARTLSWRQVAGLARQLLALSDTRQARSQGRGPARLHGARHSRERDRAAIQYHYDVGNNFYGLWLDRHRQYSCGYFSTGAEDLDTAQECKLAHICRKLRLQPGERLLDIGCGWGGLVLYAVEHYGVRALGVTLSENQAAYANEQIVRAGLGDRASVRLQDYRDLRAQDFDKIVSVGMFEHVGRSHLPDYFAQAYHLLKPGGLFLNHGIARRAAGQHFATDQPGNPPEHRPKASAWHAFVQRRIVGGGSFTQRYVFPDGELVPVSEANLVAEQAGFEVRDVENLREHYVITLRHWVSRLEGHRDEAIRLAGEVTYRTWRLFMAASAYNFEVGTINVNQTLLSKPADGWTGLPLTRVDLYQP